MSEVEDDRGRYRCDGTTQKLGACRQGGRKVPAAEGPEDWERKNGTNNFCPGRGEEEYWNSSSQAEALLTGFSIWHESSSTRRSFERVRGSPG